VTTRAEEIKWALYNWLVAESGVDEENILAAFQNSTEAQGKTITFVPVMTSDQVGVFAERAWNRETGTLARIYHFETEGSVSVAGPNALTIITTLKKSLDKDSVVASFWEPDPGEKHTGGIGVMAGSITYLPQRNGLSYRDTAQMDLKICLSETEHDELLSITAATLQVTPSNDTPLTIPIEP